MAEPRFKKAMEDSGLKRDSLEKWRKQIDKKKTKYLRLGYTQKPRSKKLTTDKRKTKAGKKAAKTKCPGGVRKCNDCGASSAVIALEALTREMPGAEAIATLFKGTMPERHCCSDGGPDCCAEE